MQTISKDLQELIQQCEFMASAYKVAGPPLKRNRNTGFKTLFRIVVDQQISVQAGAAIWRRIEQRFGEISAERISKACPSALQQCGLSKQKTQYASELANAINSGALILENLKKLDDQRVIQQLTAVRGIGIWTAEIYLMFAMGRPDILPAGDLALQVATKNLLKLNERPKTRELRVIGERWAPYRTTASFMLWQYYKTPKQ